MSEMAVRRLALVGNPNCGKSALFNALTRGRQKVGNYPGVTVERRTGRFTSDTGAVIDFIDLPGSYSLRPRSPDERIAVDVIMGARSDEAAPDAILYVMDATNLRLHLPLALELKRTGLPMIIALNMMDLAERDGIEIDFDRLSKAVGAPVVPTIAVRKRGMADLNKSLSHDLDSLMASAKSGSSVHDPGTTDISALQKEARQIAKDVITSEGMEHQLTRTLDAIFLHRVAGPFILLGVLFLMFQAVFAWAETPMNYIDAGIVQLQHWALAFLPDGLFQSLLVDGILAGVGAVVIFLPQIVLLFAFILALESSGYMPRAAFLMDRIMASVGLNGRAFIPLLSSFACAIPGIMATRTIDDPRDRLATIMIAPLMTCSARLPVYTLIIAAFIPNTAVAGGLGLQGLVMFGLYLAGIVFALLVAAVLKLTLTKGASQPLIMEMPKYQIPGPKDLLVGLLERVWVFLRRAGTYILVVMIILWVFSSFPAPPVGAEGPAIYHSVAGWIGRALHVVLAPIGFNLEISIALVPGMAAREVVVAALGTVYSLGGTEEMIEAGLSSTLRNAWSLPTALAFLAWYVFAPQCLGTLAVTKRETNSWGWVAFMFGYLIALAYVAALITYWTATAFLAG
jgi:ferrous iron transport protein B